MNKSSIDKDDSKLQKFIKSKNISTVGNYNEVKNKVKTIVIIKQKSIK